MPRWIAVVAVEREMARWPRRPAGSRWADAPVPYPTDWSVEVGPGRVEVGPDDLVSDLRTVTSTRAIAVDAPDERRAVEAAIACASPVRRDAPSHSETGGWHTRGPAAISVTSIRREAANPKRRSSFEVDVGRVVAPDVGPHELGMDRMFELFRWMVRTSENYSQPEAYVDHTVHMLLKGPSTRFDERIGAIRSRDDLHRRIQAGVLGRGRAIYDQWRSEHGIRLDAVLTIEARHHGPATHAASTNHAGLDLERAVWAAMADLPGHHLERSPNPVHDDATLVEAFEVAVHPQGFAFVVRYGLHGSSWAHVLAATRGEETFVDTAQRAMELLHRIVPTYRDRWSTIAA